MDELIEIAKRVKKTGLGSVYRITDKPLPPDLIWMGIRRFEP